MSAPPGAGAPPGDDGGGGGGGAGGITNALTVDVEDYFHVSAFAARIPPRDWGGYPSRVEANTEALLALFEAAGVRATFFVLGWVAERRPRLVRAILGAGHEVASHGRHHARVDRQSPAAFRADVRDSKRLLEDIGGAPVRGYRAASFSINEGTGWAFAVLAEEGYAYSSSVYPIRHDHYGAPGAPRVPFAPAAGAGRLVEIPLTTLRLLGVNLPCSGGGYFRLFPYPLSRWALRRVNRVERRPCVFFLHPWEIDPGQPRVPGLPLKARFRHYVNLADTERRLRRLLRDFRWGRVDDVFLAGEGSRTGAAAAAAAAVAAPWPRSASIG